jgi:hypothetical protein
MILTVLAVMKKAKDALQKNGLRLRCPQETETDEIPKRFSPQYSNMKMLSMLGNQEAHLGSEFALSVQGFQCGRNG